MAQTASIPEAMHTKVIEWWLSGLSPRRVSQRLLAEHGIRTSHTSVQRIVNRVADGCGDAALAATVMRLRLQATVLVDHVEEHLTALRVASGVAVGDGSELEPGEIDWRLLDHADRMTIRHLRLAGVGTRAGEKALEKYGAEQRRLGDARRKTLGITWPIAEPTTTSDVGSPASAPAESSATPETAERTDSPRESVRVKAPAPALEAKDHAYAIAPRTPSSPSWDVAIPAVETPAFVIPAGYQPRNPCPCRSGLRFKHCHGKRSGVPVEKTPAMKVEVARAA